MSEKSSLDIGNACSNLLALLTHAKASLTESPEAKPADAPLYPLLASVAALTRAHTTKLALVVKPPLEDPKATVRVISDISRDIIPALVSTFQIATAESYGAAVHDGVRQAVSGIFKGFESLVSGIDVGDDKADGGKKAVPDRLASTGMIWESSDRLAHIAHSRLVGLVAEKVQAQHNLLKDAVDEFREWLDSAEDEDSGFDELSSSQELGHEADNQVDQDFWEGDKPPPAAGVKRLATPALKKMQLVSILLTAVMKRRLNPSPTRLGAPPKKENESEMDVDVVRLDSIEKLAMDIATTADDMVAGFYDAIPDDAAIEQVTMISKAKELAAACRMARGGETTDEFSKWVEKFNDNIDKETT